jgi:hypothetical protein
VSTVELGKGLIARLLHSLMAAIPGASGAGLVLIDEPGAARQVAGVGAAEPWDAAQLECGCGPLAEALIGEEVRLVEPFRPDDFGGLRRPTAVSAPSALIVLPGAWAGYGRLATTLYVDLATDAQMITTLGDYEPLLANALGLLEYCGDAETRAEQMLQMMQYRRVIEQAKGMVMTRRSVGADEAFARLAEVSQRRNVRLRELAVALVESVGGALAEHPDESSDHVRPTPEAVEAATRLWAELQV